MAERPTDDSPTDDSPSDDSPSDDLVLTHLRDGTEAMVVPLLPANREALQHEYEHLSAATRFDRFLAAVPELTDTMLDHLVDEVDGVDHVALVLLVTTEDGTELPLGLARIIRYPDDPTAADLAVTVVDDWQGRGVATALLEVLMRRRPAGVERIVTVVHADNRASIAMLRRLGEVEIGPPESGTRGVVVELPGASGAPRTHTISASLLRPGATWLASLSRAASRATDGG